MVNFKLGNENVECEHGHVSMARALENSELRAGALSTELRELMDTQSHLTISTRLD